MAFRTVTTTATGISNGLGIYDGETLITEYEYLVSTNMVSLSPRLEVVTNVAGISPTITAIYQWMRATHVIFAPPATIDNFRQEVRRTNAKVSIELGQGANMWAAAEMDRGTRAITYFARDGVDLNWSRFTRWVAVQVEFITLCGEP